MEIMRFVFCFVVLWLCGLNIVLGQLECNTHFGNTKFVVQKNIGLKIQPFLQTPVEGTYGVDFVIINYVDWGEGDIVLDHHCGSKSYNGHQGTDIVIRSFRAMDSGVYVLAAADGEVIAIQDGFYDRETKWNVSKGFGNYIAIKHSNGFTSYYAHLVNNSLKVTVGDFVKGGDRIALVGSSGNSTDPHLHFELWNETVGLVDPFQGNCGNEQSLWLSDLEYDTTFQVWTSGLIDYVPILDSLKEEPPIKNRFSTSDKFITYWALFRGIRKGDSLRVNWYTPTETIWFTINDVAMFDYWYYCMWSYINVPTLKTSGEWSAKFYRNNLLVDSRIFTLEDPTSIENELSKRSSLSNIRIDNTDKEIHWYSPISGYTTLEVIDMQGVTLAKMVNQLQLKGQFSIRLDEIDIPSGVYIVKLTIGNNTLSKKVLFSK